MIGRRCKASNGFSRPVLIARDLLSKPRLQPRYFSQVTYCGGYSGEDPPLPIPNREVKLTSADGTAPPGGRVGSCRFSEVPIEVTFSRGFFFCARGGACPKSTPSVSSTPARMAQKADCTLRSGLFGQPGGVYSKTSPRNTSSFKSNHLRAVGVSRTEDASGAASDAFGTVRLRKRVAYHRRLSTVCGVGCSAGL